MAGNARYELNSASPDAIFPYAQRGGYSSPILDRSGSFRDTSDGRMFNSGKGKARGSGTPMGDHSALSQCLMLDPIDGIDPKQHRSLEIRRVLGFSVGNTMEDNPLGASHLRNSPPAAIEELKRLRESVVETCIRASGRAKTIDERLHKLTKYCEATTSKKQQQNELLGSDRSGSSSLKLGSQIVRGPSDLAHSKLDDRSKNGVLNKRVRTSVAETRAEGRSNGLSKQPLVISRDRDMIKEGGMNSDIVEEKIRKLPAGGESWDKKMKRKRSVGAVCARPIDGEGEPKRAVHHKLTSEPGLQSLEYQNLRSGAPMVGVNKLDPAGSNARSTIKIEQDKSVLSRDVSAGLSKERILAKGSIKLSNREDSNLVCPSPLAKGKAARAPRSGAMTNSVSNGPRVSATLESWELAQCVNKSSSGNGANNRKRSMPSSSSSPPITQWVGQRPQKMSRTRRANIVSPVSNHDEMQTPSGGCSPSDFGSRLVGNGTSVSLLSKGLPIGAQNTKVKPETVASPARFSESEESGAGENKLKEKGALSGELEEKCINAFHSGGNPPMVLKKNKYFVKEETGDGARKQGRSARSSSFSGASMSPVREKSDGSPTTKPHRNMRPNSDKNGSKSGRPLKKVSDRKGLSRLGHAMSGDSPDFTGESDDDREELLTCASHANNFNAAQACSSAFWKKVEGLFASISSEGKSYLAQQLKETQELHEGLAHIFGHGNSIKGNFLHEDSVSSSLSGARSRSAQNTSESKDLYSIDDSFDPFHSSIKSKRLGVERQSDHVSPMFQRLLSALILEDDNEQYDENEWGRSMSHQNAQVVSPVNDDYQDGDMVEFDCESTKGDPISSNGHASNLFKHHTSGYYGRKSRLVDSPCDELLHGDNGFARPEVEVLVGLPSHGLPGAHSHGISSNDCQYDQMCLEDKVLLELQSVDLYVETVPDLHDKEDELINQEIVHLNKGLYQQVSKKKSCLDKIYEAIQGMQDVQGQDLEHVAMSKLVEMAYNKLLATRGSLASKIGIPKVSKQVALAFTRRTLARCKKFEETGISCFHDPALRDILFAPPPRITEAEPSNGVNACDGYGNLSDQAFAKDGPILNRGKKKEALLDDFGGVAVRTTSLGGSLLGGAKGKRSDRDISRDATIRNSNSKGGRSSVGTSSKGERKNKTKPKQKTAQLSMSGNGLMNRVMETSPQVHPSSSGEFPNNGDRNKKREEGVIFPGNTSLDSGKEKESLDPKMQLHELIEDDLGGTQDLNSFFNFDDEMLQDHDDGGGAIGLDIPMDDLTDLPFC